MAARFRAAFDGGSRGNPGLAAWGVAVVGPDGRCLEGYAAPIGHATNNVAEYHGLIEALKLARRSGADRVELVSDSELLVRQIQGRYRVRNASLKPLFVEALRRIGEFESFEIRHVRREQNKEADRLVNAALNRAAAGEGRARIRVHEVYEPEPESS